MSESFYTLKVRLARPSKRKQALLNNCFSAYATGFQTLLDRKQPEIEKLIQTMLSESARCPSQGALLRLFTPEDRACLKTYGLEPFADSLIIDMTRMLLSHLTLLKNNRRTSYPLIRIAPENWLAETQEKLDTWTLHPHGNWHHLIKEIDRSIEAIGRIQSIYLGRHAENRDFCLLYQPSTGRLFAKIFLLNRSSSKIWHQAQGSDRTQAAADPLYHLTSDHTLLPLPTQKDRYVVFPLNMGQNQRDRLLNAWNDPTLLRSARLCQSDSGIDLHIHLRRAASGDDFGLPLHWIGLVRSSQAECALSICRKDGSLIRQELVDHDFEKIVIMVRKLIRQTHAQLIVSDLTHHMDGLYRDDVDGMPLAAKLSRSKWLALVEKLEATLSESGLPLPIQISPYHIYQICPRCKSNRKSNRSLPSLLVCTTCGFSQDVSLAASHNLVIKFLSYHKEKQPSPASIDPSWQFASLT